MMEINPTHGWMIISIKALLQVENHFPVRLLFGLFREPFQAKSRP